MLTHSVIRFPLWLFQATIKMDHIQDNLMIFLGPDFWMIKIASNTAAF